MKKKSREAAVAAAEAHTNLNLWGSVIALLEGGLIYGGRDRAAKKIIKMCRAEQQAELKIYDANLEKVS